MQGCLVQPLHSGYDSPRLTSGKSVVMMLGDGFSWVFDTYPGENFPEFLIHIQVFSTNRDIQSYRRWSICLTDSTPSVLCGSLYLDSIYAHTPKAKYICLCKKCQCLGAGKKKVSITLVQKWQVLFLSKWLTPFWDSWNSILLQLFSTIMWYQLNQTE